MCTRCKFMRKHVCKSGFTAVFQYKMKEPSSSKQTQKLELESEWTHPGLLLLLHDRSLLITDISKRTWPNVWLIPGDYEHIHQSFCTWPNIKINLWWLWSVQMTQHMIDLSPLIVITDIRYKIDLWWLWSQKSSNADDPMYDWLISSDCNCRHIQTHMTKLMTHPKWLWSQTSSNTHDKNYDQSEVIVITDSFTHMTKCMINPWWLW
jgi:hypothetical protein